MGAQQPAQDQRSHYNYVIMGAMASQITSLTTVYLTVYSGAAQRKHSNSAWLAFVRGIHRWPVNSPHKWPVTRNMFPFDDVIICHALWLTQIIGIDTLIFGQTSPLNGIHTPKIKVSIPILPWYHRINYTLKMVSIQLENVSRPLSQQRT